MKKIITYVSILFSIIVVILWFTNILGINVPGAYNAMVEQYKDKYGQQVLIAKQQSVEILELNRAYERADSLRDEREKQLAFAKSEIEAMGIKLKNARYFTTIEKTVSDTFIVHMSDTVYMKDTFKHAGYSDGYLFQEINFFPKNDSLHINYSITDTIIIVDNWARKPNKKGNPAFILWRWAKPWQVRVNIKSKNPKSTIVNSNRTIINEKR